MKIFIFIFLSLTLVAQKTNLAPSVPVTDHYFGTKIIDHYRNLENLKDSATVKWMKSQSDYANSVIDKISNKNYYLKKRLELDKRQGFSVSDLRITGNDRYFYLKKSSKERTAKVYYRNGFNGKEELLYNPENFKSSLKDTPGKSSHQFLVNLLSPSWDGSRLAISLTEDGKEISEVIVIDVDNKYVHPEVVTNTTPASIGGIKWLEDNSGFFYVYYPIIDSNSQEYGKNIQTVLYRIGEDSKKLNVVLSNSNNPDLNIEENSYPAIMAFNADDKYYIGNLVDSEDFRRTFIINKQDLLRGKKDWKPLYNKEDKIPYMRLAGEDIYFLSGYNNTFNYKLCKTSAKNPNFRNPEILIPEKSDEVITGYVLTKDGIYFTRTKNGVEAKLYLYQDGKERNIKTPFLPGDIYLEAKGKDFPDIWITCSGWANDEQRFKYDLQKNEFTPQNFAPIIEYPEFKDIIVEEITVKSYDGAEVPLSLIYNRNIKKNGKIPVLMNGYGAYAESYFPYFSISYLLWANQGGIVAVPHVRGGGEKGEQWHIDGQKSKKPNSWKDLIACVEYLIGNNYTSPKKIALLGGSAGGILMGRAMTERPDLFGAVIIESGVLNTLRNEYGGVGKSAAQEYGNINNSNDFKGLLEMDAYQHIKKGTEYPATLITSGINDPRVAPWIPAKFAAKLLANSSSNNPILLKIDYAGGHGGDIPVVQRYANIGDIFAFALWQLGHPEYQPNQ
ncbi:prolyl oligopeptidase family serine peptidase [Epilithonimonas vandammei]|uniref:prolyl oligopeptidase n=1 Tax=Epilithonimonas vandammei TaxID=2487072 RepID=A0A3G8Y3H4_9FLAO|nr:prolyl oligopeptidase family serine peptidase [Epilithonimonas vandammei]AZI38617.1 prolyl oligopeptidase [Epilithonimonas vandammei]